MPYAGKLQVLAILWGRITNPMPPYALCPLLYAEEIYVTGRSDYARTNAL